MYLKILRKNKGVPTEEIAELSMLPQASADKDVVAIDRVEECCICPICGNIMDTTEHSQHYCYDCAQLLTR